MIPKDRRLAPQTLEHFLAAVLAGTGARAEDAACVALHLTDASLKGHDVHGARLLPLYAEHARTGRVTLDAEDRIAGERAAILQIDAGGGWGAPAGFRLIDRAAEKARAAGLAAATLGNVHHLGRIGAYAERAAAAGLASVHFVSVTDRPPLVAPYRGSDARLGTNPVCIGFPATAARPAFLLDMTTSRIDPGKAQLAAARGAHLPEGCLIDEKGMPATDPAGMAADPPKGALTPLGLHKGYGLALACELFAGLFSGAGTIQPDNRRSGGLQNRMFSVLIDPHAFGDPQWMEREVEALTGYVLASPPMDWDSPVLYPGDPERAFEGKRRREGIPVDEATLSALNAAARAAGVTARL